MTDKGATVTGRLFFLPFFLLSKPPTMFCRGFMFEFEFDGSVIVEQRAVLERALSTNPKTQAALRKLINRVLKDAREQVVNSIRFKNGDPRGARAAVRRTTYKKILGANLNIYNSRKAGQQTSYEPPRNPSPRGGNRRPRSARTNTIMHYGPHDRGWILRFINSGVSDRKIAFKNDPHRADVNRGSRGGDVSKYGKTVNTGRRGNIAPRNFFGAAADSALARAADALANLIDEELDKMMIPKKK